jgi:hypothetical protein
MYEYPKPPGDEYGVSYLLPQCHVVYCHIYRAIILLLKDGDLTSSYLLAHSAADILRDELKKRGKVSAQDDIFAIIGKANFKIFRFRSNFLKHSESHGFGDAAVIISEYDVISCILMALDTWARLFDVHTYAFNFFNTLMINLFGKEGYFHFKFSRVESDRVSKKFRRVKFALPLAALVFVIIAEFGDRWFKEADVTSDRNFVKKKDY